MNKEIIEKELENIYRRTMDKDINNSLIKIKKALKIKEEEVLKKIDKRIKFWTPRRNTLNFEVCLNKRTELEELKKEISK